MLLEGLISGALGLIGRSLPEVLKFADRKAERKHELSLQEWQYKFTELQGGQKLPGLILRREAEAALI